MTYNEHFHSDICKLIFNIFIDLGQKKEMRGFQNLLSIENSIIWANDCDNLIYYKLIYVQFSSMEFQLKYPMLHYVITSPNTCNFHATIRLH